MAQTHIGLKVFDKDSLQSQLITPAPLTDVGVMIQSVRGIPNKAVKVLSERELYAKFGKATSSFTGVAAVKAMMDNMRPFNSTIWVTRVVDATDGALAAASVTVDCNTLKLVVLESADTIDLDSSGDGITIAAGTDPGTYTVTIDGLLNTVATTETYANVSSDQVVGAINDGLFGYTKSQMVRIAWFHGTLTTKTLTAIPPAGLEIFTATTINFTGGQEGQADAGAWANDFGVNVSVDGNDPLKRVVTVYKLVAGEWVQQGTSISGLTAANFSRRVNAESPYVAVQSGSNLPNPFSGIVRLSGGVDASAAPTNVDFIGDSDAKTGFYSFDDKGITNLLILDELSDPQPVLAALDAHLELNNSRCLGHYAFNAASTSELVSAGVMTLLRKKSWLVCYEGWATIYDPLLGDILIPGTACLYGSGYVRKMLNDPSKLPHIAPGGNDSVFTGVKSITTPAFGETELLDLVKNKGVNPIMYIPNVGYILRTSRTMSTDDRYYDVHKRRCINYIGGSLQSSLGWIEQSPNNPTYRKRLTTQIDGFLSSLYSRGMFSPEEGYAGAVQVKCDRENNPDEQVAQRILECEVRVKIVDTIETATINLRSEQQFLTVKD